MTSQKDSKSKYDNLNNIASCQHQETTLNLQYNGRADETITGLKCMPWKNVGDKYISDENFPMDKNMAAAHNYCRNPDKSWGGVWCYTNRTNRDYCRVPKCNYNVPENAVSCWPENVAGTFTYMGTVSTTVNGLTCQAWAALSPHRMNRNFRNPWKFPDASLEVAKNYCRDLDGVGWTWCFTTNKDWEWDRCSVPRCSRQVTRLNCTGEGKKNNSQMYSGTISQTISGIKCQAWTSNTPHRASKTFRDVWKLPDVSIKAAKNYCRDPDNLGNPWCYTVDRKKRWEVCDIPKCDYSPPKSLTCQLKSDWARHYNGRLATTASGRKCQSWTSNSPHVPNAYARNKWNFPDGSIGAAKNYCRDPDRSGLVWCFTMDKDKRWEPCHVPKCNISSVKEVNCFNRTTKSKEYTGTLSVTITGKKCQTWIINKSHKRSTTSLNVWNFPDASLFDAKNYCRDPSNNGYLWCYTNTPNKWEKCDPPKCQKPGKLVTCFNRTTFGRDYQGTVSQTTTGKTCQSWTASTPHVPGYAARDTWNYPDVTISAAKNYCRDPDNTGALWCYTTDRAKRWDYCNVETCPRQ